VQGWIGKVNNKIILIMIVLVLSSLLVASAPATIDDYRPAWLIGSYEGSETGASSMLYNFWHSFWPFYSYGKEQPNPGDSADMYGWYNRTFFGLANWEREVCMIDLSSDIRNVRNAVYNYETDREQVYMTTITVSSTKESSLNDTILYEISWYFVPYGHGAYYRLYITDLFDQKHYIVGKEGDELTDWINVNVNNVASNYWANYLQVNYDKAVLEYKYSSDGSINEFAVTIANKTVE